MASLLGPCDRWKGRLLSLHASEAPYDSGFSNTSDETPMITNTILLAAKHDHVYRLKITKHLKVSDQDAVANHSYPRVCLIGVVYEPPQLVGVPLFSQEMPAISWPALHSGRTSRSGD
jgi:hypothetical protein